MKLIQFTDFHLRSTPAPESQFHMQPFWRGDSRELFLRLGKVCRDADAILFTGDAAHGGGAQEIAVFFELLAEAAAGKPVFMVAGNHDVVHPQWRDYFQRGLDQHRNITLEDGVYRVGSIDLALLNNQYLARDGSTSNSWEEGFFPVPAIDEAQVKKLEEALTKSADRFAILLMHCPTHALPATLSDYGLGVVPGMNRYRETLHGVLDKHPRVGLVLSGHVHFNTTKIYNQNRVHQSLASATEYPQQVRVIDIDQHRFQTRLVALADEMDGEAAIETGSAGLVF